MKLKDEDDQLEVRLMDELMMIEDKLGEVAGMIGLQFQFISDEVKDSDIEWLKFEEKPKVEKIPVLNEEGEEVPQEEEAPVEEEQKPSFKPQEYQWTDTDRLQKNLPQLFMRMKGKSAVHDTKQAEFYSNS